MAGAEEADGTEQAGPSDGGVMLTAAREVDILHVL